MNRFNVRCQGGQTYNRLSAEQLKSLAANGMISVEDEINREGSENWTLAGRVKGLFPTEGAGETRPPAPPPSPPTPHAFETDEPTSMPPANEIAGAGDDNPDCDQESEEDSDAPAGPGGVALKVIGYSFIALGIADFTLYNLDLWDFYAGLDLAGSQIETYTAIIAGVVGGLLVGAGNRKVNLPPPAQWGLFAIASLLLMIILVTSVTSSGISHLATVRYGSMEACPDRTLDELVLATDWENPEWESFLADDDYHYVNLTVKRGFDRLLFQFQVEDSESFNLYACEVNGVPLDDATSTVLILALCRNNGQ